MALMTDDVPETIAAAPMHRTLEYVAVVCDVSLKTVKRWVQLGRLKAVRLPGGQVRVAQSELDRLLGDQTA